jgi:hypothetical protein
MANIFVNASQARINSRNNSVIHAEVRSIENAVLSNVDIGVLYANVSSGTAMTTSNTYYLVYNGVTNDPTKLDQINFVKSYFTSLGYGVNIATNATTNSTIQWNISW